MASCRLSRYVPSILNRGFHTGAVLCSFHEDHRKGKYAKEVKISPREVLTLGLKELPKEIKKFKDEVMKVTKLDHFYDLENNDYEIMWRFDSPEAIESWIVTCDSDHNEGKSSAQFILNQNKKGLFYGYLNTEAPKDGVVKHSGYCNLSSPLNEVSFRRVQPYDFALYTHLLIRARGDGRAYAITINMERHWDVQWNDQYQYILFTKGGPYWQLAKIPFSKFFLSSKGRVQDKQEAIQLDRIRSFGLTLADSNPGPFQLELDFVGAIYDESHTSTFEYEMYETATLQAE